MWRDGSALKTEGWGNLLFLRYDSSCGTSEGCSSNVHSFHSSISIFPAPLMLPCPYGLLCLQRRVEWFFYPRIWAWLLMCFIQRNVSRGYASRGLKCACQSWSWSFGLLPFTVRKHMPLAAAGWRRIKDTCSRSGPHVQWCQAWLSPAYISWTSADPDTCASKKWIFTTF